MRLDGPKPPRSVGQRLEREITPKAVGVGRQLDRPEPRQPAAAPEALGLGDRLVVTESNIKGRIQFTSMWYDAMDRLADTADYGTKAFAGNGTGSGSYSRITESTAPTTHGSTGAIQTTYHYSYRDGTSTTSPVRDDGRLHQVDDAMSTPHKTRFFYDLAGRQTRVVRNYAETTVSSTISSDPGVPNPDSNQTVAYEYSDGLRTKLTAKMPSSADDQKTTYIYGTLTTPSQMKIATGHLLRAVIYPDSSNTGATRADIDSDSSDAVSYAYNAQGQVTYMKDQAANVIETDYDGLGRETHRRATTIQTGAGFDDAIKRISTAYLSRGLVDTVTQYNNATVGSGTAKDQVQYAYDEWGNLTTFTQDPDSAIGASGRAAYAVSYTYAKNTSGRNTLRRATETVPDATMQFSYSSSNHDNDASRVTSVDIEYDFGGTKAYSNAATYNYVGVGQLVGTTYNEPNIYSKQFVGGTGPYPQMDNFDRPILNRWTRGTSTPRDFYSVDIAYELDSSIKSVVDNVHTDTAASNQHLFDALYSVDGLNRLTRANEGNLTGGSISPGTRDEQWTATTGGTLQLDLAGNWLQHRRDDNHDGTMELDESGTYNKANEQTARAGLSPGYDAVGNLTDDDTTTSSTIGNWYQYDVWGRLVFVTSKATGGGIAAYRYNGLGMRIAWQADWNADGDLNPSDAVYYFCYDEAWRLVATFRTTGAHPKERFLPNLAGLGGYGGSSYIDSVILRDSDSAAWDAAASTTLTVRRYLCQNWRGDVSLTVSDTGAPIQWVKYSAYGEPFAIKAGDANSSGDCTGTGAGTDYATIQGWISGSVYDPRGDINGDGAVNSTDLGLFTTGTLGRGLLSSSSENLRIGYAGYQWDPNTSTCQARNRWYQQEQGRWMRRDPLDYPDGPNLYEYVLGAPLVSTDPSGLLLLAGGGGGCGGTGCGSGFTGVAVSAEENTGAEVFVGITSLDEGIRKCIAENKSMCNRYICIRDLVESLNQLCGDCLSEKLEFFKMLVELWCRFPTPGLLTPEKCDKYYLAMKPYCDRCGSCSGAPANGDCSELKQSTLCWSLCIGWYKWFDTVCSKKPHTEKIANMVKAFNKCAKALAKCEAKEALESGCGAQ